MTEAPRTVSGTSHARLKEPRLTAPFPTAVETPKPATCGDCRWWIKWGHSVGNCRRYPQVVHVDQRDFCGEFKARA